MSICVSSSSDSSVFEDSISLLKDQISSNIGSWETTVKIEALKIASYLTDPLCKVREYFYTFYILDETCENTTQKVKKIAFLVLGIFVCSLLTPCTAPIGALVRGMVATFGGKPYIYLERAGEKKTLPANRQITVLSHNECYMPAGYCITDGQVTPASDKKRMDANLDKIKALDPDVVCLYEVPDICDADYISSKLTNYPFLIPVAGMRAINPSSMMYVASKYAIDKDSIEFIPFVKDTEITGRAKYSEKGILSFDILSEGAPIATIISTHLQHSETPAKPTPDDEKSRFTQMGKIGKQIDKKIAEGRPIIFTGDLNQEEKELKRFLEQYTKLQRDPQVEGKATWGGDAWCAKIRGEPPSGALTLDYTFIAGNVDFISTTITETEYLGEKFRPEATSDHYILYSKITLGPS